MKSGDEEEQEEESERALQVHENSFGSGVAASRSCSADSNFPPPARTSQTSNQRIINNQCLTPIILFGAEAQKVGAIDGNAANAMLRRLYLMRAEQIVEQSCDKGAITSQERDKLLEGIRSELSRVEQKVNDALVGHEY